MSATLAITPKSVTIERGLTQQFTCNEAGVEWSAINGVIDQNGFYKAMGEKGVDIVKARAADGRSSTAKVTTQ